MGWRTGRKGRRTAGSAFPGLPEIAGFSVYEPVGEGGFSTVYRGAQQTPGRPVAIKVFRTGGEVGARVRERFQRESAIIGELSNEDGLVNVFTGGFTDAGAPYLAMELCEGGSVADQIRAHGQLPVEQVLAVGQRIGSALAVVHSKGISHRDVKPSNILLKADGRALLTDFGLSVVGEMTEALGEESRLAMTEVYAPPERLDPGSGDGAGEDALGDQYSFALTLYAMLSGGSPFVGQTTAKRALKALHGQLEPLARTDVPPGLVELLRRALAIQPAARWPSMADLVTAINALQVVDPPLAGSWISGPDPGEPSDSPSAQWPHPGLGGGSHPKPTPISGLPPWLRPSVPPPAGGPAGGASDVPTGDPAGSPPSAAPWYSSTSAAKPGSPRTASTSFSSGVQGVSRGVSSPRTAPQTEMPVDSTRMPSRASGVSSIETPGQGSSGNRNRTMYAGLALAASTAAVLTGAFVLQRLDPAPSPTTTTSRDVTTTAVDVSVTLPPTTPPTPTTLAPPTTTPAPTTLAPPTTIPAPTTLAPPAPTTAPPSTSPPSPAPGPDEALGQVEDVLTGFMAADTSGDVDRAMSYLAPPVTQWVGRENRDFDASQLRANIGDRKSEAVAISLVDGPTLAFGPARTPDGGWMVKVNYVMHAEGTYVSEEGETQCVNNDQSFLDTLIAPSGGPPKIKSHEQLERGRNAC